jgi:hypothetical protein
MRRFFNSVRPYLGGLALSLGCFGLFFFVLAVPFTMFGAHFWGGFGFREGRQPTRDELDAAVSREFWWAVRHRLAPLFVGSVTLVWYGFYEMKKEQEQRGAT